MAVLQGLGMSRNPADFNRRFAINEKKKTKQNRRYYLLCWWSVCGLWILGRVGEIPARSWSGRGGGRGRWRACHVARRGWESPFWVSFPLHNERASERVFYSHGENFLLGFSLLWRCSWWICLFTIEQRVVMSACVNEEGLICQTYEEIRGKFALPFNKTFPKVGDFNKLRKHLCNMFCVRSELIWTTSSMSVFSSFGVMSFWTPR